MSPVLVTGGSGYAGTQLIAALLRDGRRVRAAVRSLEREDDVRAAVRRGAADDSGLEVVGAELSADEGWAAAAAGCEEVHHVAPPMVQSDDPDEVIVPARGGALRVLRAARDAGVRRVVMTSSFAAVGYSPSGVPSAPRLTGPILTCRAWQPTRGRRRSPSRTREGGDTELVVVNPTFILGPTLTAQGVGRRADH